MKATSAHDRFLKALNIVYFSLFFGFVFAPFVLVVAFAFNSGRFPRLPWQSFSLKWFGILSDPGVIEVLLNSLWVGLGTAAIATPLGLLAAYFANRWEFRGQNVYLAFIVTPPCIPLVVLALCLVIYFRLLGIQKSLLLVLVGHVVLTSPFVFAIVRLRLHALDFNYERAAWNLGANELTAFVTIVLPQLKMAAAASFLLAFAVSWDEFVVSWFLSGLTVTLPVHLWIVFQSQISASVNALGTFCFAVSVSLLLVAETLVLRSERR